MTSVQELHEIPKDPMDLSPSSPEAWTNPLVGYLNNMYSGVSTRRTALGLPSPGTVENIDKEVTKDVFLTQYFYSGLRAEVTKSFSLVPAFQVAHALSLGSPVLPSYMFSAFFGTNQAFLQGNLEADMSLSGRAHYSFSDANTFKAKFQLANAQPAMLQLEHDYLGKDFSFNFKTLNPSLPSGCLTGVFIGSLLQSLTPHLCLGLEAVYSAQSPLYPPDAAVSYVGRYATPNWIATGQLQASGQLSASFWRKVADKVEAGLETTIGMGNPQQAAMLGVPPGISGTTTIGAKYEFRQSLFRGQVDSDGKVSCLIERRVLPVASLTFAGEIDHKKNAARVGLGLQIEAGGEEVFEQQQALAEQQGMLQ